MLQDVSSYKCMKSLGKKQLSLDDGKGMYVEGRMTRRRTGYHNTYVVLVCSVRLRSC